jgi:WD40 repeat protein
MAPNGNPNVYPLATFDPTGTRLLVAGTDGAVAVVVEVITGKVTARCGHTTQPEQWAPPEWSPKGDFILSYERKTGQVCWDVSTGEEVPVPKKLGGSFRGGSWSQDGTRVATSWFFTESKESEVWDVGSDRKMFGVGKVHPRDWSPDGSKLITTNATTTDRQLRLWDVGSGRAVFTLDEGQYFSYLVRFSPDGAKFVTVSGDGKKVRIRSSQTGAETHALYGHTAIVNSAEWSPDGRRVLTTASDGTARVWDLSAVGLEPDVSGERVQETLLSKQCDWFIRPTSSDTCEVWDAKAGVLRLTLNCPISQVRHVQRQPRGEGLLVSVRGQQGAQVRLYAADADRLQRVFTGQYLSGYLHGWDPTGRYIMTIATDNRSATVWETKSDKPLLKVEWPGGFGPAYPMMKVEWRQKTERLVISQGDKPTKQWRTDTWAEVPHVAGSHSSGGERVVTLSRDLGTKSSLLDGLTGQVIRVFDEPVTECWWSPNGKWCLTRGDNTSAKIRSADTGDVLFGLGTDVGVVNHCDWSPDGMFVMTTATDGSVRVWDASTGAVTHVVPGSAGKLLHDRSAWSADGKGLLLVFHVEQDLMNIPLQAVVVRLHEKGKHFHLSGGHLMTMTTAEWSPDGKRILTAGSDFTTRVWDSESGAELLVLKTASRHAHSTWSPDGAKIVSFNQTEFLTNQRLGTLKVYDATPRGSKLVAKPPGK